MSKQRKVTISRDLWVGMNWLIVFWMLEGSKALTGWSWLGAMSIAPLTVAAFYMARDVVVSARERRS